jgi:peptidoglycan/LPS O-acetylase OafA/YrhL
MRDTEIVNFDKFPGADGIRGMACMIVVIAHALTMFFPRTQPYLAGSGKIGVWLFFVLSAFLLTHHLLHRGFNLHSLSAYLLGRLLRLMPLFTLAVIVYWVVGTAEIDTFIDIGNAILFANGYAHLWTVPVEFKFNFWLPFLHMF